MFPVVPALSRGPVAACFFVGLGLVALNAVPHADAFGWNLKDGLLGATASALFTIGGLAGFVNESRRRRWHRSTAKITLGAIDGTIREVASLASFTLPLTGVEESKDAELRFRLDRALTLPFTPTRAEELHRVRKALNSRVGALFDDSTKTGAVTERAAASATQLESRGDHIWSNVLQIHEHTGKPASGLLVSGHNLLEKVRELTDGVGYGASVAHPFGLLKGIVASQMVDAALAVALDLNEVYEAVEHMRIPESVREDMRKRREDAAREDAEIREFHEFDDL